MNPGLLRLILAAILIIACVGSARAQQQPICMSRAHMVQNLAERGEAPVASGLTGSGTLLEVLTSPSGSWSIISTQPNGIACYVISGTGWIQAPPAVPGRDS